MPFPSPMRGLLLLGLATMLFIFSGVLSASAQETTPGGFLALGGEEARGYDVPGDAREAWRSTDAEGLTQVRYQQYVGEAAVYGGQITTLSRDGERVAVTGSYYPNLDPTDEVRTTPADARALAEREEPGTGGRKNVTLFIDPKDGSRFYEVDSRDFDRRRVYHIDAQTGKKIKEYDAIQEAQETASDPGVGVKGDTKSIDTTLSGSVVQLVSGDGRQRTFDAKNRQKIPGTLFSDTDNNWTAPGRTSPGQPAGVDAHYYSNVTDDFYRAVFGRNSLDDRGMTMVSTAHYGRNYNNAFWNGSQMVYGDGDGTTGFRELSGGLDVVSHELTHGVTDFTSNLVYQNESGALNEAFSDMMGNSAEFYAQAGALDPAARPDWQIGEDVYLGATAAPGFRNMADPAEDGDPDHYSERYTGTNDNGGVHTNSGIPNHAYYLLVNGGKNAGEARGHNHAGPTVTAIGLSDAQQIFYKAFTGLPSTATMAQSRQATESIASGLYGPTSQQRTSTSAAWEAVGVR